MTRIVGTLAVIWALKAVGIASATSIVFLLLGSALIHTALWLVSRRSYEAIMLDLKIPPSPRRAPTPQQHDPNASTVLAADRAVPRRSGTLPARHFLQPGPALQAVLGDRYIVGPEIGRGGFGRVIAVRDLGLRRDLAVKVVPVEGNADAIARFEREAAILANLHHPHIVPVHFMGTAPEFMFMAMPLVKGQTLRGQLRARVTDAGPVEISFSEIGRILAQTASALEAAHLANVVHRDVKPENILIEAPTGSVQVMDFGIAKLIDPARPALPASIVGTWCYMSPEQWTGEPLIDGGTDIYSLACVTYELVTGRPPFRPQSIGFLAFRDYRDAHLTQEPASIRSRRLDCPEECDRAVLRALSKRRADRFKTVGGFADAFVAGLDG